MVAAAIPISIYPAWEMLEYAISLLKFFWGSAIKLPSIKLSIERIIINKMIQIESLNLLIPINKNLISPEKAASFAIVVMSVVIIVGEPS